MLDETAPTYGEVDGESVDDGRVALSGGGHLLRALHEGEAVILIVRGEASLPTHERLKDESLRRVDHLKIATVLEPTGDLLQQARDLIAEQASLEAVVDPNQTQLATDPPLDDPDGGRRAD